jgi:hypothetical protein
VRSFTAPRRFASRITKLPNTNELLSHRIGKRAGERCERHVRHSKRLPQPKGTLTATERASLQTLAGLSLK